ncbi:catechol 2,3-dioxygenase-like lactoylglutathione lyase family enzyme [Ectopseudomonas oleovorans]|uniref:Bleomycin resistance protein n=1 Tax=Ectopseudomonas oleovorans TaxID=301 RepID=A0A397NE44_ECTOL|nr:VOC family protein [Pseudomonas oleovorans]RIA34538.1 catechol 2,3-dioxygenase-like lactoylglutathione lyase family enzyme [Pseudomonas oleovorans]
MFRPLPALTPELLVHNLSTSLGFYCDLLGFKVLFERVEQGFVAIGLGEAALMLEQIADNQDNDDPWVVGPLDAPLGRGINLQITVDDIERLLSSDQRLRLPLEDVSYQAGAQLLNVRQFMLQDPDGYLLRFSQIVKG